MISLIGRKRVHILFFEEREGTIKVTLRTRPSELRLTSETRAKSQALRFNPLFFMNTTSPTATDTFSFNHLLRDRKF